MIELLILIIIATLIWWIKAMNNRIIALEYRIETQDTKPHPSSMAYTGYHSQSYSHGYYGTTSPEGIELSSTQYGE